MTNPQNNRCKPAASGSGAALFGREWIRAPFRVGAVAPSGRALARVITQGLSADDAPVIELGPGTGVFTRALLERGIQPDRLALIEASAGFAAGLADRFPHARIIHADAERVRSVAPWDAKVIICGLPLLSMPLAKIFRIVEGSFATLRNGGEFRLFTYGLRCPVPRSVRARLGLAVRRTAFVPLNIPPAAVYTLTREVRNE